MIVFRHNVTDFGNIQMTCEGHAGKTGESLPCAAASALMAAITEGLRKIETPKLNLAINTRDGFVSVRCRFTQETAAMAMTTVAGFEWLAGVAPDNVRCERVRPHAKK